MKLKQFIKKFFYIDYAITDLRDVLYRDGLAGGISYLKSHYRFIKPSAVRFLLKLYEFLEKEQTLSSYKQFDKPLVLHVCCWGSGYAEKAKKYLIPSLLAEGNLPALAKSNKIILYIHCDKNTKDILFSHGEKARLSQFASIEVVELPDYILKHYRAAVSYPNISFMKWVNRRNHVLKYLLLGAFQTHALHQCIDINATVSFLVPDVVLSDSFFSIAMEKIAGKTLVGTSTFRTNFFTVKPEIDEFYTDSTQTVLTVSAADIARMQVKHLHPHEKRRVVSEQTKHYLSSPRLIFNIKNGLLIRALQYHPILLDCSKISGRVLSDYCPIDDTVLNNILKDCKEYEEQIWLCDNASLMNIMELSGDEPNNMEMGLTDENGLQYTELVSAFHRMICHSKAAFDNKLNHFFIQNKLKFQTEIDCHQDNEIIDSDIFIHDAYKLIEKSFN